MSDLKREQKVIDTLKSKFGDKILEAEIQNPRRIHAKVADPDQRELFAFAMEKWNAWHMIAISGVDTPDGIIACVYHFDIIPPHGAETAVTLNLRVDCADHDKPVLTSVSSVIPGAQFFERETHDLMGIVLKVIQDSIVLFYQKTFQKMFILYEKTSCWKYKRKKQLN